jgi:hypothetical protein
LRCFCFEGISLLDSLFSPTLCPHSTTHAAVNSPPPLSRLNHDAVSARVLLVADSLLWAVVLLCICLCAFCVGLALVLCAACRFVRWPVLHASSALIRCSFLCLSSKIGLLAIALFAAASSAAVNLGAAGPYSILAYSTITSGGPSSVIGDMGLSPGTAVVGFGEAYICWPCACAALPVLAMLVSAFWL